MPGVLRQHSEIAVFAQRSNDLSMNFGGKKWSPHPIPPSSLGKGSNENPDDFTKVNKRTE